MTKRHTTGKRSHLTAGVALALGTTLATSAAQAEIFGIMNGRSAAPPATQTSVEGAFQFDDDVTYIGIRGNYAVSPTLTAFVNLSNVDRDSGDNGYVIGGGTFFHLTDQRILPGLDIALKPSIGYLDADGGSSVVFAGEALVSGRATVNAESIGWYGNLGLAFTRTDSDFGNSDTDLEAVIGGGLTLPVGPGTAYAGIDIIDNVQLGVGYRYAIR